MTSNFRPGKTLATGGWRGWSGPKEGGAGGTPLGREVDLPSMGTGSYQGKRPHEVQKAGAGGQEGV